MKRNKKSNGIIGGIVNILKKHERDLSDGYEHYAGYGRHDVDDTLTKIAKKIIGQKKNKVRPSDTPQRKKK